MRWGDACRHAFDELTRAVQQEYRGHDHLIQALALHYHFAAMHPFLDGNGRTARALEALVLQRAGLTDRAFIAMSNYYYDEKDAYLAALSEAGAGRHNLTPFLVFGLRGIKLQCDRLFVEIKKHVERALFRNTMYDLFNRFVSPRKRVIHERQIELLKLLLEVDEMTFKDFVDRSQVHYRNLSHWTRAFGRDFASLYTLKAIELRGETPLVVAIRPQWPQEITESEFFEKIRNMPRGKSYKFLP